MKLKDTVLIRLFVPRSLVARIDTLAEQVGNALGHEVSRAGVARALIKIHVNKCTEELASAIASDDVKRGRRAARAS